MKLVQVVVELWKYFVTPVYCEVLNLIDDEGLRQKSGYAGYFSLRMMMSSSQKLISFSPRRVLISLYDPYAYLSEGFGILAALSFGIAIGLAALHFVSTPSVACTLDSHVYLLHSILAHNRTSHRHRYKPH